ncbi:hypothetical protein MRX96_016909 [Rhipicephalus microplus]
MRGEPSPHLILMPLGCQVCGVATDCEEILIAHLKTETHKKTIQREEYLRNLASAETSPPLSAIPSPPTTSLPSATTSPISTPRSSLTNSLEELEEQNGEVIDLSCRVCGIGLFEHIGYKLEHLETEAHRMKKMQVTG